MYHLEQSGSDTDVADSFRPFRQSLRTHLSHSHFTNLPRDRPRGAHDSSVNGRHTGASSNTFNNNNESWPNTPTWHLTLLFNLLPLRILVPSAGQRWSSSVISVASWAVFPVRSELHHFSSNVFRCHFSVFTLFCCMTLSRLTTSRTNSHSSFDFNFCF